MNGVAARKDSSYKIWVKNKLYLSLFEIEKNLDLESNKSVIGFFH